jgi:hypothetical protein
MSSKQVAGTLSFHRTWTFAWVLQLGAVYLTCGAEVSSVAAPLHHVYEVFCEMVSKALHDRTPPICTFHCE